MVLFHPMNCSTLLIASARTSLSTSVWFVLLYVYSLWLCTSCTIFIINNKSDWIDKIALFSTKFSQFVRKRTDISNKFGRKLLRKWLSAFQRNQNKPSNLTPSPNFRVESMTKLCSVCCEAFLINNFQWLSYWYLCLEDVCENIFKINA